MECETDLSDCEKISCIENAMSSSESKDIVRHASVSGSYNNVIAALRFRYDKVKLVHKHHVSQLLSLYPVGDDHDSLVRLKHTLAKHLGGIAACKADTFGQFIAAFIETLVSHSTLQAWSEYSSDQ